jgi:hypothetical protein
MKCDIPPCPSEAIASEKYCEACAKRIARVRLALAMGGVPTPNLLAEFRAASPPEEPPAGAFGRGLAQVEGQRK